MPDRADPPVSATISQLPRARRFATAIAVGNVVAMVFLILAPAFRIETAASLRVLVVLMGAMLLAELRPGSVTGAAADLAQAVSWILAASMVLLGAPHLGAVTLCATTMIGAGLRREMFAPAVFNASQLTLSIIVGTVIIRALDQHEALTPSGSVDVVWLPTAVLAGLGVIFVNGVLTGWMRATTQDSAPLAQIRFAIEDTLRNEGVLLTLAPATAVLAVRSPLLLPIPLFTALAVYHKADEASTQKRAASHDTLTGLPNRRDFERFTMAQLDQTVPGAVVLVDLDGFKAVNDRLGHHAGDEVLQVVADRLQACCGPGDHPARLGGDEFAAFLAGSPERVETVAREVVAAIALPMMAGGVPVDIGASLGIALTPEHGLHLRTLLERADATMYTAKRQGLGVAIYQPGEVIDPSGRAALQEALRQAVDEDDIEAHFQPWIDTGDGSVLGMEALARWRRPDQQMWMPQQFLPLATDTELAHELTLAVCERAVVAAQRWQQDHAEVQVSVNVPPAVLRSTTLAADIEALLYRFPIDPRRLAVEISDRGLADRDAELLDALAHLRRLGVGLIIDDFGSGPDSLVSLSSMGAHTVKLGSALTGHLAGRPRALTVVRHLLAMGGDLGVTVVAKRVDDADTARTILDAGAALQGHLVSPPLNEDDSTDWLRLHEARLAGEDAADQPAPAVRPAAG